MKRMNSMKFMMTLALLAVVVLGFALTGCSKQTQQEQTQETAYKIGLVVPTTGAGAIYGDGYVQGVQLALEEKNVINGHEIELFVKDSKFEGKASVDAANYLLNKENVDILVSIFHLPANSINSLSKEKQVPHIYEAITTSLLEENPYAFKANFDALHGCEELMEFAKSNEKYETLGVLMAQTEYSQLCLEGVKKVNPEVKEYIYIYTFGETDFKTMLTKMNNDGVDTLMTRMADFEYLALFKQLTELGYPIDVMCATASECINPMVKKEIPNEMLNQTLAIDMIPADIKESNFRDNYFEKYSNASATELNYATLGYEMIQYVSEAMKSCDPQEHDCLNEALKKVTNYETNIDSDGFENRTLQLKNKIYVYNDGDWIIQQ